MVALESRYYCFYYGLSNNCVCPQVLAYMHAQNAHFHQGYDLFSDLEPYMKQVASQVKH